MLFFIAKVLFSGILIAFASWLSIKKPILSGFLIALPLVSIISIGFSYMENKDFDKTILFAKSIFVGVPLSLTFFVPFLFAKNLGLNFVSTFTIGIFFLIIAYFIHEFLLKNF